MSRAFEVLSAVALFYSCCKGFWCTWAHNKAGPYHKHMAASWTNWRRRH